MNSERIRQQFGTFGIDVIECSDERRVSSLYSVEDGRKICRTWAVVEFNKPVAPALAAEHALVLSGQSIGVVFKSRGWTINKRHTRFGNLTLADRERNVAQAMGLRTPTQVAVHAYVFEVKKGVRATHYTYGSITEIHHPDYLGESDLKAIYGTATLPLQAAK